MRWVSRRRRYIAISLPIGRRDDGIAEFLLPLDAIEAYFARIQLELAQYYFEELRRVLTG